jgi:hypothetical protein
MFTIEKNIPMPKPHRENKYTSLTNLEPGDSFVAPADAKIASIRASFAARRISLCIRRQEDGTYRIWHAGPILKKAEVGGGGGV